MLLVEAYLAHVLHKSHKFSLVESVTLPTLGLHEGNFGVQSMNILSRCRNLCEIPHILSIISMDDVGRGCRGIVWENS